MSRRIDGRQWLRSSTWSQTHRRSSDIFKNADPCSAGTAGLHRCRASPPSAKSAGSDGIAGWLCQTRPHLQVHGADVVKRMSAQLSSSTAAICSRSCTATSKAHYRNDNTQIDPNISSLFDFTNTDGLLGFQSVPGVLPNDRRHQLKLFGELSAGRTSTLGLAWSFGRASPSRLRSLIRITTTGRDSYRSSRDSGPDPWTFPLDLHGTTP